jgi:hypothetical protein
MAETRLELEAVTAALSEWRANKKSKHERVPVELLKRARDLRGGDVSDREICKVTGLSWTQLIPKPKAKRSAAEFVEIPPLAGPTEMLTIEVHDGSRSIIVHIPGVAHLPQVIATLRL